MVDSVEIETMRGSSARILGLSGRGVVDSVEIETHAIDHALGYLIGVEEVWWTLSRLKPLIYSPNSLYFNVEEVWWTLSRLKQRMLVA